MFTDGIHQIALFLNRSLHTFVLNVSGLGKLSTSDSQALSDCEVLHWLNDKVRVNKLRVNKLVAVYTQVWASCRRPTVKRCLILKCYVG